jgi:predicted amidohydrolase
MTGRSLHVAAAQVHSGGTVEQNLSRHYTQARAAAIVGAKLILFAEGSVHGYDYDMTRESIAALAQPMDGPDAQQLSAMAAELGIVIVAGFYEAQGPAVYNSMLIAWPEGRRQVARKHMLTTAEKNAGISPGLQERTIITVDGVNCGIVICADAAIRGIYQNLHDRSCDLRLCPTGGGGSIHDTLSQDDLRTSQGQQKYIASRQRVFRPEAILPENDRPYGMGFVSANALGPMGRNTFHQGHCMIVDGLGVMRAQIPGTIVREHAQDQMIHSVLHF